MTRYQHIYIDDKTGDTIHRTTALHDELPEPREGDTFSFGYYDDGYLVEQNLWRAALVIRHVGYTERNEIVYFIRCNRLGPSDEYDRYIEDALGGFTPARREPTPSKAELVAKLQSGQLTQREYDEQVKKWQRENTE